MISEFIKRIIKKVISTPLVNFFGTTLRSAITTKAFLLAPMHYKSFSWGNFSVCDDDNPLEKKTYHRVEKLFETQKLGKLEFS